jgi:hypothetical protein
MADPEGNLAVDYIAATETMELDWPVIVKQINRRRDPKVPAIQLTAYPRANVVSGGLRQQEALLSAAASVIVL